jgi:hypothetical protein
MVSTAGRKTLLRSGRVDVALSERGEYFAESVRMLAPTLSAERIKHREHRADLCELTVHIRQRDL